MEDDKLRAKVLTMLRLTEASQEDQELALYHVQSIAYKRFVRAVPELLTEEQLKHVEKLHEAKHSDEDIVKWIEKQIPDYDKMIDAIIQDVAEEMAKA